MGKQTLEKCYESQGGLAAQRRVLTLGTKGQDGWRAEKVQKR